MSIYFISELRLTSIEMSQGSKFKLTLLLLSMISELSAWMFFALRLRLSSPSFSSLSNTFVLLLEDVEEIEEVKDEDFLLLLTFFPNLFSSRFKVGYLKDPKTDPPDPLQESVYRCHSVCGFPDKTSDVAQTPPGWLLFCKEDSRILQILLKQNTALLSTVCWC